MTKLSPVGGYSSARCRLVCALGLVVVITSVAFSDLGAAMSQAQTQGPCGLVTAEEVQALVPEVQIGNGVASALPNGESATCRYTWGEGVGRETLAISVQSAARMFAGKSPDAIKQDLAAAIVAGTPDERIADLGEAAVFKEHSSAYVVASAYLKERVLQVSLDGLDAHDKKSGVIGLLKSAASRF